MLLRRRLLCDQELTTCLRLALFIAALHAATTSYSSLPPRSVGSASLSVGRTLSTGGKGTARRKVIKKSVASLQADDKKVQAALKKLNVAPLGGVEEVNMFQEDGNVLHFSAPTGASDCYSPRVTGLLT